MSWFWKSKEEKLAANIEKNGKKWAEVIHSIKTNTILLEDITKKIEKLRKDKDTEGQAREELKRYRIIKTIEDLKELEEKLSKKVKESSSELDHNPAFGLK